MKAVDEFEAQRDQQRDAEQDVFEDWAGGRHMEIVAELYSDINGRSQQNRGEDTQAEQAGLRRPRGLFGQDGAVHGAPPVLVSQR
ncbi:hypothetical protein [Dyella sp. 333MFSha]|uniref:hypothetical protein n=1 Tax=Dyella sp. 333MFSha TaxID=1798240 RepID=UPI00210086E0|nr:hypothetical protein [Dyella sp. 333MFSha]